MLEFHPLANIFSLIEGDEFDALVNDIKVHGLRDSIVMLDGKILDGRNRYRAGLIAERVSAGGGDRAFREFDPAEDGDPVDFVLSKNLTRRHLNETQRASAAAKLANMPRHRPDDKSANLRTSQTENAGRFKVSPRLVSSAKVVQDKGTPALNKAMDAGKIAASAAAQASKLPAAKQDQIAADAEAGKANVVRTVIKQGVRNVREQEQGKKQWALPDKKYGVILADPEHRHETWSRETGIDRAPDNHYQTTEQRHLMMREVAKIAAKDCMLALWVTDLANGIRIMESWGFVYKSYFVWVKDIVRDADDPKTLRVTGPVGLGRWNRDRDEIMLIGTRGDFVAPAPGTQPESVWFSARPRQEHADRGKHSAKPEDAHLWIEANWPSTPKIELNARVARAGWDNWGNELPPPEPPEHENRNQDRFEYEFNQDGENAGLSGQNEASAEVDVESPAAASEAGAIAVDQDHSGGAIQQVTAPAFDGDRDMPSFLRRTAEAEL